MRTTDVLGMMRSADRRASSAAVLNAHHREAVRLAYLVTGDLGQAEDIVSEVFVRVENQWEKGRVDDVRVYLRRAVIGESNSKLRRRSLERRKAAKWPGDELDVRRIDEHAADHDQVWRPRRRVGTVKRQTSRGLDDFRNCSGRSRSSEVRDERRP